MMESCMLEEIVGCMLTICGNIRLNALCSSIVHHTYNNKKNPEFLYARDKLKCFVT